MSGHGSCYLVANGDDGKKYWAYVKKYSDDHETSFKAKVKAASGHPCRSVKRDNSQPSSGTEIKL
jgi:hypothetical protein